MNAYVHADATVAGGGDGAFFHSTQYFIPSTHHCVTMINYSWKSVYHLVSVYFFFDVVVSWLLNNGFATVVVLLLPSRFGF